MRAIGIPGGKREKEGERPGPRLPPYPNRSNTGGGKKGRGKKGGKFSLTLTSLGEDEKKKKRRYLINASSYIILPL